MIPPEIASENVLVLAERSDDALGGCGDVITALSRAGRPPFVVVLTDGDVADPAADRRVRDGLAALGLAGDRMLMFGIAGELPRAGRCSRRRCAPCASSVGATTATSCSHRRPAPLPPWRRRRWRRTAWVWPSTAPG